MTSNLDSPRVRNEIYVKVLKWFTGSRAQRHKVMHLVWNVIAEVQVREYCSLNQGRVYCNDDISRNCIQMPDHLRKEVETESRIAWN